MYENQFLKILFVVLHFNVNKQHVVMTTQACLQRDRKQLNFALL